VLTGRVEQGTVKPGDEVIFLPTHTPSTACTGKVRRVQSTMQHGARVLSWRVAWAVPLTPCTSSGPANMTC
jgi:translation elongation factor EF-1alpha